MSPRYLILTCKQSVMIMNMQCIQQFFRFENAALIDGDIRKGWIFPYIPFLCVEIGSKKFMFFQFIFVVLQRRPESCVPMFAFDSSEEYEETNIILASNVDVVEEQHRLQRAYISCLFKHTCSLNPLILYYLSIAIIYNGIYIPDISNKIRPHMRRPSNAQNQQVAPMPTIAERENKNHSMGANGPMNEYFIYNFASIAQ